MLNQSLMGSKSLQHLNCSNIPIVLEKQHINADELDSCGDLNHIRSQGYDSVVGVFWQQVLKR